MLEQEEARKRPDDHTWSPVEYACHVRDMTRMLEQRLEAMLQEHNPELTADLVDTVGGRQWERPGRRSDGFEFTIATLCLYIGHELEHHLHDVGG